MYLLNVIATYNSRLIDTELSPWVRYQLNKMTNFTIPRSASNVRATPDLDPRRRKDRHYPRDSALPNLSPNLSISKISDIVPDAKRVTAAIQNLLRNVSEREIGIR